MADETVTIAAILEDGLSPGLRALRDRFQDAREEIERVTEKARDLQDVDAISGLEEIALRLVRIAERIREAFSFRGIRRSFAVLRQNITRLANQLQSVSARLNTFLAGILGIATVRESLQLAERQFQAEARLLAAVGERRDVFEEIKQAAADLQAITIVGDEDLLEQAAILRNAGIEAERIPVALQAAVGVSAGLGRSLNLVVRSLSQFQTGSAGLLGQQIPLLKQLQDEGRLAAEGIEVLAEQFSTAAEAAAQTDFGRVDQLLNLIGDDAERIGQIFVRLQRAILEALQPAFQRLADVITGDTFQRLFDILINLAPILVRTGTLVGSIVAGFIALAGVLTVGSFLAPAVAVLGSMLVVLTKIGVVLGTVIFAFRQVSDLISAFTGDEFSPLSRLFERISEIAGLAVNRIKEVFELLRTGELQARDIFAIASAELEALILRIRARFFNPLTAFFKGLGVTLRGLGDLVVASLGSASTTIGIVFGKIFDEVSNSAISIFRDLLVNTAETLESIGIGTSFAKSLREAASDLPEIEVFDQEFLTGIRDEFDDIAAEGLNSLTSGFTDAFSKAADERERLEREAIDKLIKAEEELTEARARNLLELEQRREEAFAKELQRNALLEIQIQQIRQNQQLDLFDERTLSQGLSEISFQEIRTILERTTGPAQRAASNLLADEVIRQIEVLLGETEGPLETLQRRAIERLNSLFDEERITVEQFLIQRERLTRQITSDEELTSSIVESLRSEATSERLNQLREIIALRTSDLNASRQEVEFLQTLRTIREDTEDLSTEERADLLEINKQIILQESEQLRLRREITTADEELTRLARLRTELQDTGQGDRVQALTQAFRAQQEIQRRTVEIAEEEQRRALETSETRVRLLEAERNSILQIAEATEEGIQNEQKRSDILKAIRVEEEKQLTIAQRLRGLQVERQAAEQDFADTVKETANAQVDAATSARDAFEAELQFIQDRLEAGTLSRSQAFALERAKQQEFAEAIQASVEVIQALIQVSPALAQELEQTRIRLQALRDEVAAPREEEEEVDPFATLGDRISAAQEQFLNFEDTLRKIGTNIRENLTDGLVDVFIKGEKSFKEFLGEFLIGIGLMIARLLILGAVATALAAIPVVGPILAGLSAAGTAGAPVTRQKGGPILGGGRRDPRPVYVTNLMRAGGSGGYVRASVVRDRVTGAVLGRDIITQEQIDPVMRVQTAKRVRQEYGAEFQSTLANVQATEETMLERKQVYNRLFDAVRAGHFYESHLSQQLISLIDDQAIVGDDASRLKRSIIEGLITRQPEAFTSEERRTIRLALRAGAIREAEEVVTRAVEDFDTPPQITSSYVERLRETQSHIERGAIEDAANSLERAIADLTQGTSEYAQALQAYHSISQGRVQDAHRDIRAMVDARQQQTLGIASLDEDESVSDVVRTVFSRVSEGQTSQAERVITTYLSTQNVSRRSYAELQSIRSLLQQAQVQEAKTALRETAETLLVRRALSEISGAVATDTEHATTFLENILGRREVRAFSEASDRTARRITEELSRSSVEVDDRAIGITRNLVATEFRAIAKEMEQGLHTRTTREALVRETVQHLSEKLSQSIASDIAEGRLSEQQLSEVVTRKAAELSFREALVETGKRLFESSVRRYTEDEARQRNFLERLSSLIENDEVSRALSSSISEVFSQSFTRGISETIGTRIAESVSSERVRSMLESRDLTATERSVSMASRSIADAYARSFAQEFSTASVDIARKNFIEAFMSTTGQTVSEEQQATFRTFLERALAESKLRDEKVFSDRVFRSFGTKERIDELVRHLAVAEDRDQRRSLTERFMREVGHKWSQSGVISEMFDDAVRTFRAEEMYSFSEALQRVFMADKQAQEYEKSLQEFVRSFTQATVETSRRQLTDSFLTQVSETVGTERRSRLAHLFEEAIKVGEIRETQEYREAFDTLAREAIATVASRVVTQRLQEQTDRQDFVRQKTDKTEALTKSDLASVTESLTRSVVAEFGRVISEDRVQSDLVEQVSRASSQVAEAVVRSLDESDSATSVLRNVFTSQIEDRLVHEFQNVFGTQQVTEQARYREIAQSLSRTLTEAVSRDLDQSVTVNRELLESASTEAVSALRTLREEGLTQEQARVVSQKQLEEIARHTSKSVSESAMRHSLEDLGQQISTRIAREVEELYGRETQEYISRARAEEETRSIVDRATKSTAKEFAETFAREFVDTGIRELTERVTGSLVEEQDLSRLETVSRSLAQYMTENTRRSFEDIQEALESHDIERAHTSLKRLMSSKEFSEITRAQSDQLSTARTLLQSIEQAQRQTKDTRTTDEESKRKSVEETSKDIAKTSLLRRTISQVVSLTRKLFGQDSSFEEAGKTETQALVRSEQAQKVLERIDKLARQIETSSTESRVVKREETKTKLQRWKNIFGRDIQEPPIERSVGGPVPGYGRGDIVPAMLEPGEHVIQRSAVRYYGPGFIEAINRRLIKREEIMDLVRAPITVNAKNMLQAGGQVTGGAGDSPTGNIPLGFIVSSEQEVGRLFAGGRRAFEDVLRDSLRRLGVRGSF